MKFQSSSKQDTSTLPTIPDNSFVNHDQKLITKQYFHPLFIKIKELENTLMKCDHQKLTLLQQQQQLKSVLMEKLRAVQALLGKTGNNSSQQFSQQCSQKHQNWRINQMNHGLHKQSQFKPKKTHIKYYSALNSPRAQPLNQSNILSNSRVKSSLYTDEEVDQQPAYKFSQSRTSEVEQQHFLRTSKIKRQNVQSYISKYESIEEIWNESDLRYKKSRHCQLKKTYL